MSKIPFRNPGELQRIKAIAGSAADGPIIMLNLNRYKEVCEFPDGALYSRYMNALDELLHKVGAQGWCARILKRNASFKAASHKVAHKVHTRSGRVFNLSLIHI